MNLTNADTILINKKKVQQISIDGRSVYTAGYRIRLTSDKSFIVAGETAIITLNCTDLPHTQFELYGVIDMTRTLLDTLETDENGQATYEYTGTGAGSVGFVAVYDDTESNTVVIDDYTPVVTTVVLESNKSIAVYGETVGLTATVTDQHGQAVVGETVSFKVNGTQKATGTTNNNGVATASYTVDTIGNLGLTATADSVTSTAVSLVTSKANTALTIETPALVYSDMFDVNGTLKDSNNTGIVGEEVTLHWQIGTGTEQTATTETTTNGAFNFHSGPVQSMSEYTFWITYAGDIGYNSSTSSEVTVNPDKETSVLNVSCPATTTSGSVSVTGTLKDNDNTPMAGENVYVQLGGHSSFFATVESDGSFSGTVTGLSLGSNNLFFMHPVNQKYTLATQTCTVVYYSFDDISLSLTAGSQILSYADEQSTPNSQYATVTAQLLNGQVSALVSGVPVVFGAYQNDVLITGSEQTVNTDSNGQASYTYHSAGVGDVVVKAVPDNRTLLTKTFTIQDILKYIETTSKTFSTSSVAWENLADLGASLGDCEVSAILNATDNRGFRLDLSVTNQYENKNRITDVVNSATKEHTTVYDANGNENTHFPSPEVSYTANTDVTVKIKRQNNQLIGTIGNFSYTFSDLSNLRYLGIVNWSTAKTVTIKELKVKLL